MSAPNIAILRRFLLIYILIYFSGSSLYAQISGDCAFLQGRFVEVGIAPNGGFGSTVDAPTGYHPNISSLSLCDPARGTSVASTRYLGFVADYGRDGWTTGTPPYIGDYYLPGTPQEGWAIQVGSSTGTAYIPNYQGRCTGYTGGITGTTTGYSSGGGISRAFWTGSFAGLTIKQTTRLDTNDLFFTINVVVKNSTAAAISNVYYMRTLDPDNEQRITGSFSTINRIDFQIPSTDNKVLVSTTGNTLATSYLGLGTKDCRAKCVIFNSGLVPSASPDSLWNQLVSGYLYTTGSSNTTDAGVALVYNLGTIGAGDSSIFTYTYILNATYIDSALNATLVTVGAGASVCLGDSATISANGALNYSWTPSTGLACATCATTRVSPPTTTNYYVTATTVNGCVFRDSTLVTVNPRPDTAMSVSGPLTFCEGSSVTLSVPTVAGSRYNWFKDMVPIAGATNASYVATTSGGYNVGIITDSGCYDSSRTRRVVVNPLPQAGVITGPSVACIGSTITLADTAIGGTWSSVFPSIATISATGVVTPVTVGVDTIKYTVTNLCGTAIARKVITVNPTPDAGIISGPDSICQSGTATYTNTITGGAWSSSNTSIATINSSGVALGLAIGYDTIRYTVGTVCGNVISRKLVYVKPLPAVPSITGGTNVCVGSTLTLSNALAGGVWSSSNASIASINSSGVVSGVAAGTATITYSVTNSCGTAGAITNIIVSTTPNAGTISGASSVCVGGITTLTTTGTGGTWSSMNTSLATVTTTGIVTGVATGDDSIRYTVTNACGTSVASKYVAVIAAPTSGTISGSSIVCVGATTTLTASTTGGVWSNVNTAVATVGTTGIVTGVSAGLDTIRYTVTNTCGTASSTKPITVLPIPNAGTISGSNTVCTGVTTTLTTTGTGGVWSSVFPAIATIGATTGVVTGVSVGVDTLKYTVTNACGTSVATKVMTINLSPNAGTISGASAVCVGSNIPLTTTGTGGTWSSVFPSIATINSAGVVTGVTAGVDTLKYTVVNSCGTSVATKVVTVNALPSAGTLSGPSSVCAGSTITWSSTATGGTWSSQSPAIATVVVTTGVVTGVSAGIDTIIYTNTNSCGTASARVGITVNPLAVAGTLSGPSSVCVGSTITITSTATGGSWASSNTSLATVNTAGVVTGVAAGVDTIYYLVTNGCGTVSASKIITINALPVSGTISGPTTVCVGANMTLNSTATGGVWSSVRTALATVQPSTGIVTGVSAGVDTIQYTVTNGCGTAVSNYTITINPLPVVGPITGPSAVCVGATIALADTSIGGTWSSSNTTLATVAASGVVTGATAGVVTISYTMTNGCGTISATKIVTVNALPTAGTISGSNFVCIGGTTTLTSTVSGGSWSSSNTSVATVNASTGLVGGVSAGVSRIVYTQTNTCGTDTTGITVSVNASLPAGTLSGPTVVCTGQTITLTPSVTGGTFASGNTTIATVGSSTGIVTGVGAGTVNISYAVTSACGTSIISTPITVNLSPNAGIISGPSTVCTGTTVSLTTTGTGGTWSSSDASLATVSTSGVVTGVAVGSVTITYEVTNSCGTARATRNMTINLTADAGTLSGPTTVCQGSTINITSTATGGTWSSSNTAIATVDGGGTVTGVSGGSATISYSVVTACGTAVATAPVTVVPTPNAGTISGLTSVCTGSTTTLTTSGSGGTWSSGNTAVATIHPTTGVVLGVSNGTAGITYTVSNSCGTATATTSVTVNTSATAGTISGPSTVCVGSTVPLTSTITGGTWTSSNNSIATVGSTTGVVRGNSAGAATISYIVTTSCGTAIATYNITVGTAPSAGSITGGRNVCIGSNLSLSTTGTGGTWSSSDATLATVSSAGSVLGINSGNVIISYTVSATCGNVSDTHSVAVSPAPNAGTLSGASTICLGSTSTMTTTASGGIWTSSNTAVATIDATGLITTVSAGTTIISYTATTACGTATSTQAVTVNTTATAGTLSGASTLCIGNTTTLSSTVSGGTWSSSDATVATIDPTSGVVTGVASGSAILTYTVINGCGTATATYNIAVSPAPVSGVVSGSNSLCVGSNTTLTTTGTGGSWSSSNPAIATVNTSGIVTALSAGNTIVSYTVTASCGSVSDTQIINVLPLPAAGTISGATVVCIGGTTNLTTTGTGGVWSSSNAGVASINSIGVVSGIATGTAVMSYTVSNICGTSIDTHAVAVSPAPFAGTVTGPGSVCAGGTISMFTTATGGVWSSSDATVATINSAGLVTGLTAGTTIISYTATTACGSISDTAAVTVRPAATAGTLSGAAAICVGNTVTISSTVSGGTWSSSNATVATINSTTGAVTGISAGTATLTYTVTSSCGTSVATHNITVSPVPNAGTLAGPSSLCLGSTATITTTSSGGSWSSSNPTVAAVNTSGLVSSVSVGTAIISYTVATACSTAVATHTITVDTSVSAGTVSGASTVCEGGNTTWSSTISGGTWSSSNAAIATIHPTTGVITGVAAGAATISYTVTNGCGTATTTASITVSPAPSAGTISGPTSMCRSTTNTFTATTTGGVWSSSNASVASINSAGTVTAIAAGTTIISYTVTSSCGTVSDTALLQVQAFPYAGTISGPSTVCIGGSSVYVDTVAGGVWSSGDNTIATVSSTGVVTGVRAGSVNIYYSVINSCGAANVTVSINVAAGRSIGAISGPSVVCTGGTITLVDTASGGTWSSSNMSVASVHPTLGRVTGVSAGTATITYTLSTACGDVQALASVTVLSAPDAGTLSGDTSICIGSSTTIASTVSGGVWSSSDAAIATVDTSGLVRGISAGSVTISYGVSGSCGMGYSIHTMSIVPTASAGILSGDSSVCISGTRTLASTVSGGTWSSSNPSVATINPGTGVVTAVSAGVSTISYGVSSSCGTSYSTTTFTVSNTPLPGLIMGATSLCAGISSTFTETIAGGVWSSSAPTIATVSSTGVVTTLSGGSVIISYSVTNACGLAIATAAVSVRPLPDTGVISGPDAICIGSNGTYTETVTGGVWSSSNTSVATINTGGIAFGVSSGFTQIAYTVTNSCGSLSATKIVRIESLPTTAGVILGSRAPLCPGATTLWVDTVIGGTWSSTDTSIARVSASGLVTGVAGGNTLISYSLSNSCGTVADTASIHVLSSGASASIISSTTAVCAHSTLALSATLSGGTWSSADVTIATIDTVGVITGISAGSTLISYSYTSSCGTTMDTVTVIVHPTPSLGAIAGTTRQCVGSVQSYTNSTSGGTWSSSNASIASVDTMGNVTGVSAGIATITYSVSNIYGCTSFVTLTDTVQSVTDAGTITGGTTALCVGGSATLVDTVAGGTWSSTDTTIASISSTGLVTAHSAGSTTISYTVLSGACASAATVIVDVNPTPATAVISGVTELCTGTTASLTASISGGSWSSSAASVATIDTTGLVSGISSGIATMRYTLTNIFGCSSVATHIDTVRALPTIASIVGPDSVCMGSMVTLTDTTTGGYWRSSNASIATISSTGMVTGVAAGSATISYTVGTTCSTTVVKNMTVLSAPTVGAIVGSSSYCVGGTGTLTNSTSGGTWSSSMSTVATVSTSGVITALSAGTATISYFLSSGSCSAIATMNITVHPIPSAGTIVGPSVVCMGSSALYTDSATGGTWSTSNVGIATISSSGMVLGVSPGAVTISYSVTGSGGCSALATRSIIINSLPSAGTISGTDSVCIGGSITWTSSIAGGTWYSGDTTIARISATGIVTGISSGSTTISYTVTSAGGCSATATKSIRTNTFAVMTLLPASGRLEVCHGTPVTMSVTGGGAGYTYQWYRNGVAVSGATSTSHTTSTAGVYSVVVSFGSCSITVSSVTVTVSTVPVISTTGGLLYTSGYATYQWFLNGVAISGANTSIFNATAPGSYRVVVTSASGCRDTSAAYIVTSGGSTGVTTITGMDIKLFPNPATSVLMIEAPTPVRIMILTIDGKLVIDAKNATTVDVSLLANAIYMVKVYDSQTQQLLKMEKFVKMD